MSKWWIQLGITPERIRPGTPAQNGRHERLHRTLKDAVPAQATLQAQQRQYDPFRAEYNWQRSHEALGRQTPGSVYRGSPRPYPVKLPAVEYESGVTVRQVRHNGEIKWQGELIYVSGVLAHEQLGLTQVDDQQWAVRYSFHRLGILDQRLQRILPATGWHGAK